MPKSRTVSAEKAGEILREVDPSKAFYFYRGMDSPLNQSARSLKEFAGHVRTVEAQSLDFHSGRGDFERWAAMLGDKDFARKLTGFRTSGSRGEQLRSKLSAASQSRVDQLTRVSMKIPR